MNHTANYKLPQWVEDDRILMEDFNQAMETIDAGLQSKASGETVAELAESVDSQLEAIAANLGSGGKTCRVAYGSYTGTGTYGASNAVKLNFDFCPVLVLIANPYCTSGSSQWPAAFFRGVNVGHYCTGSYAGTDGVIASWGEKSLSYYSNYQSGEQNNSSGATYYYIAIGYSL